MPTARQWRQQGLEITSLLQRNVTQSSQGPGSHLFPAHVALETSQNGERSPLGSVAMSTFTGRLGRLLP